MTKNTIAHLLFKPLILTDDNENMHLTIIFAIDEKQTISLSATGKKSINKTTIAKVLDISSSIDLNKIIAREVAVQNEKEFCHQFEQINKNEIPKYAEELSAISYILMDQIASLSKELEFCGQIFNSMNLISNDNKIMGSEGEILLTNNYDGLVSILFKTADGDTAKLKESDIKRLSSVVRDIVHDWIDKNLDAESEVKRLESEIKYKLIDALPAGLTAGNMQINTEVIIDEIKKNQSSSPEVDDEDSED